MGMRGLEMGTNTGDRSPKDQEGSFGGSVEPGSTRDDRECRRLQRRASSESEVASLLALCKRRCVHHRLVPSSAVRWGGRIDVWGPRASECVVNLAEVSSELDSHLVDLSSR